MCLGSLHFSDELFLLIHTTSFFKTPFLKPNYCLLKQKLHTRSSLITPSPSLGLPVFVPILSCFLFPSWNRIVFLSKSFYLHSVPLWPSPRLGMLILTLYSCIITFFPVLFLKRCALLSAIFKRGQKFSLLHIFYDFLCVS